MTLNDTQKALLTLLAQALWGNGGALVEADWEQVEELAKDQGVLPMLYRGAMKYKDIIPAERIRIWRGAMYAAVLQNDRVNLAQSEILGWLAEKGIRAAILKGTSVARYYNPPDMRCLGDIDLLICNSDLERVSAILCVNGYELLDQEHGFHVKFQRSDILVEVHYAASEIPDSECYQDICQIMNSFLDDILMTTLGDERFPALSETNHALMLLLHMERHMMAEGIGLRQICDWAVYINSISLEHWRRKIEPMLKTCGLSMYAKVITRTCEKYLALSTDNIVWCHESDDKLAYELVCDIFRAGNLGHADNESNGNIFSNRSMLGNSNQWRIIGLIMYMNKLAYANFPVVRRCKVLLPVMWVFIPLRYFIRSILGLRPRKNVSKVLLGAKRRQQLYKALHLYEPEKIS